MDINNVIDTYVKLREQKDIIQAEADEKIEKINDSLHKMEGWLKIKLDELGLTQFKAESGTVFLSTVDFCNVEDWALVLNYIIQNKKFDLLERRVSKLAIKQILAAKKDLPPGVKYVTMVKPVVRRASSKIEGE